MFFFYGQTREGVPENLRAFLERNEISWGDTERMLNAFREIKPDITVGTLLTFLFIARRTAGEAEDARITIKNISDSLGMNYQSTARHCDVLSDGVGSTEGLGWLEKSRTPNERGKSLHLSQGGVDALMQVFNRLASTRETQSTPRT